MGAHAIVETAFVCTKISSLQSVSNTRHTAMDFMGLSRKASDQLV